LWAYLNRHAAAFNRRKSAVYRGQPPFAVFGVGAYTFAPYKVMVAGMYKQARFVVNGPQADQPVVCDDTCYLLPFDDLRPALVAAAALNHPLAQRFIHSLVFWDAKRPITKTLLQRIDLAALIQHLPAAELRAAMRSEAQRQFPGQRLRLPRTTAGLLGLITRP
jgi:hypothetical protein